MQHYFHIPFTSRGVNEHAKTVTQKSSDWVQQMGLLDSFSGGKNYRPILIGELVARTHPTFPADELQLIADWAMWLFINDDLFDKLSIPYRQHWQAKAFATAASESDAKEIHCKVT